MHEKAAFAGFELCHFPFPLGEPLGEVSIAWLLKTALDKFVEVAQALLGFDTRNADAMKVGFASLVGGIRLLQHPCGQHLEPLVLEDAFENGLDYDWIEHIVANSLGVAGRRSA